MPTFQEIVKTLSEFWASQGCVLATPYDLEKGAGTSNPMTFLRALGPEPYRAAYIEPCRRPKDGRYGENPNRLQHYFQYQVILKPPSEDILDLYLASLRVIGLKTDEHDIRFVHDDWENPTLGAWGLGWEVWIDGMEMTQFTYFQSVAGLSLLPITGEITYGIERIAMCLQGVDSIFDVQWNEHCTYGDIYKQNEVEWSGYNFIHQDDAMWMRHFQDFKNEAKKLVRLHLPIPAYDFVVKSSHAFNMLDAKGVISVTERASYIGSIRDIAKEVAEEYVEGRKQKGFPLLDRWSVTKEEKAVDKGFLVTEGSDKEDFVFEIGIEELPATFVPIGMRELEKHTRAFLASEKIGYEALSVYGTPRRLVVIASGVRSKIDEEIIERRGPRVDACWNDASGHITDAGRGFLTSSGIEPCSKEQALAGQIPELSFEEIKGVSYLMLKKVKPSRSTASVLFEILPTLVAKIQFPKSMRWADPALQFARPIRWLVALFGAQVLPVKIGKVVAGKRTFGSRQLTNSRPIVLQNASEYLSKIEHEGEILVDPKAREKSIVEQLLHITSALKARVCEVKKVMEQVVFLVEKPFVHVLDFNDHFLHAPKEVLISEMVEHQKYFPLEDERSSQLLNQFVIVANRPVNDAIARGNKKVLSARLKDGLFLWQEDTKTSLEEFREKLRVVTYQAGAGSLYDKTERMRHLAITLKKCIPEMALEKEVVEKAAIFAKADLTSQLVGEFPELQGVVGMYLALLEGMTDYEARALRDHWLPNQDEGDLPLNRLGDLISMSDKLDTLAIFFTLGMKPTSSSDPFALRRSALGLVRILIEQKLNLSMKQAIHEAVSSALKDVSAHHRSKAKEIEREIFQFILGRVRAYFIDKGYGKECVDALFCDTEEEGILVRQDNLYDAYRRLEALFDLKMSEERMKSFVEVMKRCLGQLGGVPHMPVRDEHLLTEPSEKELFSTLRQVEVAFMESEKSKNWKEALDHILSLQKPIDRLFSEVKVLSNDEGERKRRLGLLQAAFDLMNRFADIRRFLGFK